MSGTNKHRQSRIPKFASREEEAEFWDTHDIADYWDELKPVRVAFSKKFDHAVLVQFDSDTFDKVHRFASERGVFPDALIHDWIVERLKEVSLAEKTG